MPITFIIDTGVNQALPIPTTSDPGVTITRTQSGGSGGGLLVAPRTPILNRNFSIRRATSAGALDSASPIQKSMMVQFELDGLVDPIWFFDENEESFLSHVDGEEPQRTLAIRVAKSSPDLPLLEADAYKQPAKPYWHQLRAIHADDSDYSFRAEFFASPTGAAQLGAGGNVRYVEFPLATVIHGEGHAVRFIVTEPV